MIIIIPRSGIKWKSLSACAPRSRSVQRAEDCGGGNVGSVYGRALLLYRGLMASSERERGGGGGRTTVERFFFFSFIVWLQRKRETISNLKAPNLLNAHFEKPF